MLKQAVSLRKPTSDLTEDQLRSGFMELLDKLPPGSVQGPRFFSLPANVPPWFDTGMALRPGEEVTVLVAGRAILSTALDLAIYPEM